MVLLDLARQRIQVLTIMDPTLPTPPPLPPPPPPHSTAAASPVISVNPSLLAFILHSSATLHSNTDLLSLVRYYFDLTTQTLDLLAALDQSLHGAAHRHDLLRIMLKRFEEDNVGGDIVRLGCKETIGELRGFRAAGDTFGTEFSTLLYSVCDRMMGTYENVKEKKRRGDRKLNMVRVYRKVSGFIFAGAFVAVAICSAVVIAFGMSRLVAIMAMLGLSGPLVTVGIWFDATWRKYEDEMKGERVLIGEMNVGSFVIVKDLDNIRVLVDKLEVKLESFLGNADMALRYEEAVSLVVEEIGKSVDLFLEEIRELMKHGEMCRQDVLEAKMVAMQKIIKFPGYS